MDRWDRYVWTGYMFLFLNFQLDTQPNISSFDSELNVTSNAEGVRGLARYVRGWYTEWISILTMISPTCKLTHVFCDKIRFRLLHPVTSLSIYVLYYLHKTQTCRLQLIFVRLHDLLANSFQCFPSIFKIWYLIPNLRTTPHPYLPVMRVMRYVSVPVIKEPLADGIVDGFGVFDPWWDG